MSKLLDKDWHKSVPEIREMDQNHIISTTTRLKASIRKNLLSTLSTLFSFQYESQSSFRKQLFFFIASTLIEILQLHSLLWFPNTSILKQQVVPGFWGVLGYARFDNICAGLNFLSVFVLGSVICIGLMLFGLLLCFLMKWRKKSIGNFMKTCMTNAFLSISKLLYVPFMVALGLSFKYSVVSASESNEYGCNANELIFPGSSVLSPLALVVLWVFKLFYDVCYYEIRHSFHEYNLCSRAHSTAENIKVNVLAGLLILYVFFAADHLEIFRIAFAGACLVISWTYFTYQPFYSPYANALRIISYLLCALSSLFFVFGYLANNDAYPFILIILIEPVFFIIAYSKIFARVSNTRMDYSTAKNIYEFELGLRSELLDPLSDQKLVIDAFSDFISKKPHATSRFLRIWCTNYCYYTIGDYCLTRIKMGMQVNLAHSFDEDFQTYIMVNSVKKTESVSQEDIQYLSFRSKFERTKRMDMKLCVLLLELTKLLGMKGSTSYLFSTCIPKIAKCLEKLKKNYMHLFISYPMSISLIDYFSGFLSEIVNETGKANELLHKKQDLRSRLSINKLKHISYFDEENGLMIISGSQHAFGIITYANASVGKILQQPESTIIGNSINTYVPSPFDINHDNYMQEFLIHTTTAEIKLPLGLFLQTQKGFLVECYIQIRCTALDSSPFFLVLLKERKTTRGIVVLSSQGFILNHSENAPMLLEVQSKTLKDESIDKFLKGISFMDLQYSIPIAIKRKTNLFIVKSFKLIKNKHVSIAYLINDSDEIRNWKRGLLNNECQYNIKQHFDAVENADGDLKKLSTTQTNNNSDEADRLYKNSGQIAGNISDKINLNLSMAHKDQVVRTIAPSITYKNVFESNPIFNEVVGFLRYFKCIAFIAFFLVFSLQGCITAYLNLSYDISSIDILEIFANASSVLIDATVTSRQVSLETLSPLYLDTDHSTLLSLNEELSNLTFLITTQSAHFSCGAEKALTEYENLEFVPSRFSYEKQALINILNMFISTVNSFVMTENSTELSYILINGEITTLKLLNVISSIVTCYENEIGNKGNIVNIVTIASVLMTALGISLVLFCTDKAKRENKKLWSYFSKLLKNNTTDLKLKVIERLVNVHQQIEYEEEANEEVQNATQKMRKANCFFPFFRFFIFILLATGYYLFIFTYFIPNANFILDLQLKTLSNLYSQRVQSSLFLFWTTELYVEGTQNSLETLYNKYWFFEKPSQEIDELQQEWASFQKFYLTQDFQKTLTSALFNDFFYFYGSYIGGIYELANEILLRSYDLDNKTQKIDYQTFRNFIEQYKIYNQDITTAIIANFSSTFSDLILIMTAVSVFYILISFIFLQGTFSYIINSNISKVKATKKLGEIIPAPQKSAGFI